MWKSIDAIDHHYTITHITSTAGSNAQFILYFAHFPIFSFSLEFRSIVIDAYDFSHILWLNTFIAVSQANYYYYRFICQAICKMSATVSASASLTLDFQFAGVCECDLIRCNYDLRVCYIMRVITTARSHHPQYAHANFHSFINVCS